MSWRDQIQIHPAADLVPPMSADELRELGEDIKKCGQLTSPIAIHADGKLLDGRNRLDALEAVGLKIELTQVKNGSWKFFVEAPPVDVWSRPISIRSEVILIRSDPYEYVRSANVVRRHLDAKGKREAIAALIKASPEKSDRQIAEMAKTDHKKVGRVRKAQEATGAIAPVEKRVGADGKARKQPAKKQPTKEQKAAELAVVSSVSDAIFMRAKKKAAKEAKKAAKEAEDKRQREQGLKWDRKREAQWKESNNHLAKAASILRKHVPKPRLQEFFKHMEAAEEAAADFSTVPTMERLFDAVINEAESA